MYRNVYYNRRHKQMHLWTWDDQGNRTETVEPFKPYLYLEYPEGKDGISIYNTNLRKLEFDSGWDRKEYVNNNPYNRIFYNLPEEQQYLIEKFEDSYDDLDFGKYPLKIYFLDIEVYSPKEFPEAKEAKHPINLITICDYMSQKYYTFGLEKDYTSEEKKEKYFKCSNEIDLLQKFLKFWEYDYPDVVCGFNSDNFDIPYIANRIINKLGEASLKRLSPVNNVYTRLVKGSKFRAEQFVDKWFISGITVIDYMDVYKQYARGDRESYSLDYIGKYEEVGGKTQITNSNLAQLSETDWDSFVKYNIQDVKILSALEDKLKYISIMRMIAYRGLSPIEKALGKVYVINGAIALQARKHNKLVATFKHDQRGEYAGGFVKEVTPGLIEGITSFDANSLYPSAIITLNLSPETKIGRVIHKDDGKKTIITTDNKEYVLTKENFNKFLKNNKISMSCANILFSQTKKGIVAELMDDIYKVRVENKKDAELHDNERSKFHKNSKEYKQHTKIISDRDIMQYTLKILLNSVYGAMANPGCCAFDLDLASSITNTGQMVAKQAGIIIDSYAKEKYNIDCDSITVYNDTDSAHITLKPILDKLNESLFTEPNKLSPKTYELAIELNDILNQKISQWAKTELNSLDDRFYFKRETICSSVLYEAKKHYIMHILDKGEREPKPCDKIKPVGVALARSTYSDEVKSLIKEIIKVIFFSKNRKDTSQIYRESYEKFKTLNIFQMAFRTNVKDLEKYDKQTDGLITPKGCPVHVKSAIYYNYFIDKLNLNNKYDKVISGTKIKWIYCSKNKYNIKTMAFVNSFPKEFEDIFKPDYGEMFSKLIASAIQRLYECLGWNMPDIKKNFVNDLLDLFA